MPGPARFRRHIHVSGQIIDGGSTPADFVTRGELADALDGITPNETFVTNITENETYVENFLEEVTNLTEISQSNTYVTNLVTQITNRINAKKGLANELATLDGSGKLTSSQIPDSLATDAEVAAGYQPLDSDLTAIAALTTTSIGRSLLAAANAAAIRTISGAEVSGAAAAAQAASQPVDSDLTAIAALSTTSYGRAFLALADAAAGRTALGLGTAATSASSAFDASGAASAAQAASQPLDSDLTAIAALSTTSYGRAFLGLADAAALRIAGGVVIGTDVEAHDSDLTTFAGLSPSNDDIVQRKSGAWANRTIAQLLTDLGLGALYQPLDTDLTNLAALSVDPRIVAIPIVIDGGGSAITTGVKIDITIPFACTINEWTILLDQSGSIVFDIWKDTYANYPPVVGDSITASAKPTVTTATKAQSSTLTGWGTSIAAGDTIRINVDSITTATRALLSLKVTKS